MDEEKRNRHKQTLLTGGTRQHRSPLTLRKSNIQRHRLGSKSADAGTHTKMGRPLDKRNYKPAQQRRREACKRAIYHSMEIGLQRMHSVPRRLTRRSIGGSRQQREKGRKERGDETHNHRGTSSGTRSRRCTLPEQQRKMAINQISGKVSSLINDLRNDMVQIISNINVNIDYPEYDDVEIMTNNVLVPKIQNLKTRIEKILKESENGKIIKEGIKTSIIGRPNVGKSSLLNNLLEEDKAIVTDIAGTTRDIVEGQISINGVLLNMIDTAGIRETNDLVESIGVEKSLKIMEESDLILFMVNNNEEITDDIIELLDKIGDKNYLLVINKIDLERKIDLNKIKVEKSKIVELSVKDNKGIDDLKNKIIELFNLNSLETKDPTYLSNTRSLSILRRCLDAIKEVEKGLINDMPIDMIELDIKNIWEELGKINGTSYEEELLDEMFSRFCLGK